MTKTAIVSDAQPVFPGGHPRTPARTSGPDRKDRDRIRPVPPDKSIVAARVGVMFSSVKHYDYIALHAQKAT